LEPAAGESGCTWILGGEMGSALPATTQQELKYKKKIFIKFISKERLSKKGKISIKYHTF